MGSQLELIINTRIGMTWYLKLVEGKISKKRQLENKAVSFSFTKVSEMFLLDVYIKVKSED